MSDRLKENYNEIAKKNYLAALEDLIEKFRYYQEGFRNPPYLIDFLAYISWKEDYINKLDKEPDNIDWLAVLRKTLDLLGKLLKGRKIKVDIYGIEEYDKPREIEKVMFGGKWRKKYITSWVWKKEGELDPCEINSEQELKDRVEEWKNKTYEVYKYVLEKYGKEEADILFDILEIRRAPCYEGKIDID